MFVEVVKPCVEFLDGWEDCVKFANRCERMGRISHRSEERMEPAYYDETGNDWRVWWGTTERFLRKYAVELGHRSILRHGVVQFVVTCSRACSHQLVRHHVGFDITQESQRYCVYADGLRVVCPPGVGLQPGRYDWGRGWYMTNGAETVVMPMAGPEWSRRNRWLARVATAFESYKEELDAGADPEDARFLLPNATATTCGCTLNGEALMHFLEVRALCRVGRPQWEIQGIALDVLRYYAERLPMVAADLLVEHNSKAGHAAL